jgi:beta-galactosidase
MDSRPRTELTGRGLRLASGGELDFFTAEIHYWRLPKDAWAPCLAAVKELGFEIASTYVPWSVHETAAGRYDWSGARDLGAFLDEVERAGLHAVIKPGPHINAELTHFGFPERIVRDGAMQARGAGGSPLWLPAPPHMFPVPSYASAAFRAAASAWLAEVGRVAGPRRHPDGPVVAVQVDNEFQHFFRLGAHDGDYHPDAIAWWREDSGEEGDPPRSYDPSRSVRWVAFKEVYAERALAWVRSAIDEGGLGEIAHYHNAPPSHPALVHLPRAAHAVGGPAGLDFYHRARDYRAVRERALYLGGTGAPLPIAAEIGVGGPPWLPPMSPEDQAEVTRGVLAGGARGLCFFMVVDRERWYGAPVSETGALRPPADFLRRLLAALREVEWTSLRRRAPAALVMSRAEPRHAIASSLVDPLSPVVAELLDLGPGGAAELARDRAPALHRRWMRAVADALDDAGVGWDLVDEDAPDERFAGRRLVIAPTLARVDRRLWARLHALAASAQVVIGPERPARDELDRPLGAEAALPRRVGLLRSASLDDLAGLADDLARAVGGEAPVVQRAQSSPAVHISVFENSQGKLGSLTVGNPLAEPVDASLSVPAGMCLCDPLSGQSWSEQDGLVEIPLGAFGVRLLTALPT